MPSEVDGRHLGSARFCISTELDHELKLHLPLLFHDERQAALPRPAVLRAGHPVWFAVLTSSRLSSWHWPVAHPHLPCQDTLLPLGAQGALGAPSGPHGDQAALVGIDGWWIGICVSGGSDSDT